MDRTLLVILLCAICANARSFRYDPLRADDYQYALMMDAGSSGTRIHIYVWESTGEAVLPDVQEAPIGEIPWINKTKPGISSFASNPKAAGPSLAPLIDWAKSKVPVQKQNQTLLFLKATAGMRLLPKDQQENIMLSVRKYLGESGFVFRSEWAKIISGQEEGLFGWVSVNFLLHSFGGSSTFGALDLGGASTQIVFEPTKKPLKHLLGLTFLNGKEYNLYGYSFLGYGNDQARLSLLELLASESNSSLVENPCFPQGYSTNFSFDDRNWNITGSSDFKECYEHAMFLLHKDKQCELFPCSINGIHQPLLPSSMTFYAFSGYAYINEFFSLPPNASLDVISSAVSSYCHLTWEEINRQYPNVTNPFLMNYCFMGTWVLSLLQEGYGFTKSSSLVTQSSLNGVELSWSVGAMLSEASAFQWEQFCSGYDCPSCSNKGICGWCGQECIPLRTGSCPTGFAECKKNPLEPKSVKIWVAIAVLSGVIMIGSVVAGVWWTARRRTFPRDSAEGVSLIDSEVASDFD